MLKRYGFGRQIEMAFEPGCTPFVCSVAVSSSQFVFLRCYSAKYWLQRPVGLADHHSMFHRLPLARQFVGWADLPRFL